jgi:cysteinyl-tRNA synthetase
MDKGPESAWVVNARATLKEMLGVLGLFETDDDSGQSKDDELIALALDIRNQLRVMKQYELSDTIRDRLKELGIEIEDTEEGARWKRV